MLYLLVSVFREVFICDVIGEEIVKYFVIFMSGDVGYYDKYVE